jgi:NADPH-dependent ferric siderophore reductase
MDTTLPATRRTERVRYDLKRRDLVVARVERPTPGFAAITFTGEDLADFQSRSFDDHVKLLLPAADGSLAGRDYTPRRFDAARRELTIEFLLHGHGLAAEWARNARPGDPLQVGGPRGSMLIPLDYQWHLLAGDASALPAIRRRLEELPAGARTLVVLQLEDPADAATLHREADLQLQLASTAQEFIGRIAALPLPAGEGFAWAAGEAATMARVREELLVRKGQPHTAARIAAYWKHGASAHHQNLE